MSNSPREKEVFRFCMLCQGEFKNNSDIEKECTNCGYVYFIAAKPSAGGIIINSKNQILLIKRNRNPFKGSLDIPAGFVDYNETSEEALVREMKEEVNLDVTNFKFWKSVVGDYDFKGVIKQYITSIFIVKVDDIQSNMVLGGSDAVDARFYDLAEINLSEVSFKSTRDLLSELQQDLNILNL